MAELESSSLLGEYAVGSCSEGHWVVISTGTLQKKFFFHYFNVEVITFTLTFGENACKITKVIELVIKKVF